MFNIVKTLRCYSVCGAMIYHSAVIGILPELVSALRGLLDVVMALEPVGVACVAVAAAAKAAKFCMALRPEKQMHSQIQDSS